MVARSLVAVLALSAFAIPASAFECEEATAELTTPATGVSLASGEIGGENPGVYYVDTTLCQPECLFDLWIYEETNGIPGLQRDNAGWKECWWIVGDTIIF